MVQQFDTAASDAAQNIFEEAPISLTSQEPKPDHLVLLPVRDTVIGGSLEFLAGEVSEEAGLQSKVDCVDTAKARGFDGREVFTTGLALIALRPLVGGKHSEPVEKIVSQLSRYLDTQTTQPTMSFFEDQSVLPGDVDTTAILYSSLCDSGAVDTSKIVPSAEAILANADSSGIIQVYFDQGSRKVRYDQVVAVNALYLVNQAGLGGEAAAIATEKATFNRLRDGSYLEGGLYYHLPDSFLYFAARLIANFPDLRGRYGHLVEERLAQRAASAGQPLEVALRIAACRMLGVESNDALGSLCSSQEADGGWPCGYIFRTGQMPYVHFGSRAIGTIFALHALS